LDKEQEEGDEDLDYRALENGYVSWSNELLPFQLILVSFI